jgi:hypothetical protein
MISASAININGWIDIGGQCLALCCESVPDVPATGLCGSGNENLIGAASYLAALLHKNKMAMDIFTYKPNERERIVAFAKELLGPGEV